MGDSTLSGQRTPFADSPVRQISRVGDQSIGINMQEGSDEDENTADEKMNNKHR